MAEEDVKIAARIFVLEQGIIMECGSHDKLLQLGGTPARLFKLQTQNYQ